MDEIFHQTGIYAARRKDGNIKFWQMFGLKTEDGVFTYSQYWQENGDGVKSKVVSSTPSRIRSMNIGKKNETNLYDQTLSEINSAVNFRVDRGYRVYVPGEPINDIKEVNEKIFPMLAESPEKLSKKTLQNFDLPWMNDNLGAWKKHLATSTNRYWIGQPKIDGFREIRHDLYGAWSRNCKPFDNPEAREHIKIDTQGLYLDGELMMNLEDFQESGEAHIYQSTSIRVKKFRSKEMNETLHYYCFDIFDPDQPDLTTEERLILRDELFQHTPESFFQLVPWIKLHTWEEVEAYETEQLALGYEGIMLKDPGVPYRIGKRTSETLKIKRFKDEEFRVVDVIDGDGKKEGCALFVCDNGKGKTFKADMIGTHKLAKEIFENKDAWIGKEITIRHQPPMSRDEIPRLPKAIPLIRKEIEG